MDETTAESSSTSTSQNEEAKESELAQLAEYKKACDQLRSNARKFCGTMEDSIDTNITAIVEEFLAKVKKLHTKKIMSCTDLDAINLSRPSNSNKIPDKEFVVRRSFLTEMLDTPHIKTIYNIFVAILLVLFINTAFNDLLETGSLKLHLELVQWSFAQLHTVMAVWVIMFGSTLLLLYPGFQYWAVNRHFQDNKSGWDTLWLGIYLLYTALLLGFPVQQVIEHQFAPASVLIVICEQIRFIMKIHAFVRTNVPIILRYEPPNGSTPEYITREGPFPDFKKFLYFLFAPTFIYREIYPSTPRVRWSYVVINIGQMIACIFYVHYVFVRFVLPFFRNFGEEPVTLQHVVQSIFNSMLPGTFVLLIGFFAVLHSWLNAFAEMLQFGDRMFYKDWWNSTSYSKYYRTWNVVVHDWLYFYIYKDFFEMTQSWKHGRLISRLLVITVSAFFHEYAMTLTLGFFYPVLFVLFGMIGVLFLFLPDNKFKNAWNVYLWVTLFTGNGILISLYSMEWYARINCPPYTNNTFYDKLIPRTFTCIAMQR